MALVGIIILFFILILLVLFLPVINGIGSYKRNRAGGDKPQKQKRGSANSSSFSSTAVASSYSSSYQPFDDSKPNKKQSNSTVKSKINSLLNTEAPVKFSPSDVGSRRRLNPSVNAGKQISSSFENEFDLDQFIAEQERIDEIDDIKERDDIIKKQRARDNGQRSHRAEGLV